MYKLLILASVLAVAYGKSAHVVHTAAVPLTYTAGVVHQPVVHHAGVVHQPLVHHTAAVPVTYTAGVVHHPVVHTAGVVHRPVVYTSGVHHTVPVVHTTGTKVVHAYKPVEQHGYKIVY